ncbi:MAG: hypothetical protein EP338_02710 [Bacteroidetes bacterium]|nr:MAG: hypothetical protein EP338_02710 [Bacteroidota bacterium]
MKKKWMLGLFVLGALYSCEKNKKKVLSTKCQEQVPTDQVCQAHFERWFYNQETGNCEQKSYGGCNTYGFETREACECECDEK